MKLIEKLRGPALNAANARINELEERLEEAKKDGQDGWDRLAQCRVEKAELRDELEEAKRDLERMRIEKAEPKDEHAIAQAGQPGDQDGLINGGWCGNCEHSLLFQDSPVIICRKQKPPCAGYEARE